MIRRTLSKTAPITLIGAVFFAGLTISRLAPASPDGAEWETVTKPDGCQSCHLGAPIAPDSDALTIEGVPGLAVAGTRYELTITLVDPLLENAGFLLSAITDSAAGRFEATDMKTDSNGSQIRSNWDGSFPGEPGKAKWTIAWFAPDSPVDLIRFDIWANAGNYDASPLGDRLHHRAIDIEVVP